MVITLQWNYTRRIFVRHFYGDSFLNFFWTAIIIITREQYLLVKSIDLQFDSRFCKSPLQSL